MHIFSKKKQQPSSQKETEIEMPPIEYPYCILKFSETKIKLKSLSFEIDSLHQQIDFLFKQLEKLITLNERANKLNLRFESLDSEIIRIDHELNECYRKSSSKMNEWVRLNNVELSRLIDEAKSLGWKTDNAWNDEPDWVKIK